MESCRDLLFGCFWLALAGYSDNTNTNTNTGTNTNNNTTVTTNPKRNNNNHTKHGKQNKHNSPNNHCNSNSNNDRCLCFSAFISFEIAFRVACVGQKRRLISTCCRYHGCAMDSRIRYESRLSWSGHGCSGQRMLRSGRYHGWAREVPVRGKAMITRELCQFARSCSPTNLVNADLRGHKDAEEAAVLWFRAEGRLQPSRVARSSAREGVDSTCLYISWVLSAKNSLGQVCKGSCA